LYATSGLVAFWEARCIHCDYVKSSTKHPFEDSRPFELPLDRLNYLPVHQDIKPIAQAVETSPVSKSIQSRSPIAQLAENSPGVKVDLRQEPIARAAKNSPGVEAPD
jgi:hypothetical protein